MSRDEYASGEEDFFDASEELDTARRDSRVAGSVDLDLLDLDHLLDAIAEWPSPSSLGEAWSPSALPQLSLPRDETKDAAAALSSSEDEFDPERTPRPTQRDHMRRSIAMSEVERTPPSLYLGAFPAPPPRSSPSRRRRDSLIGPGDEEDDDDWHSDALSSPSRSSPAHSRHGSYERNAFRWSSSTTSTVLTMPSHCRTSESFEDIVEEEEDIFAPTAPLQIRRRSELTRRRASIEQSMPPAMSAPRLTRAHTEPPRSSTRRSKEPEWNTLIDALFGIEPRPAPRPPVWKERDLPAIPTAGEKHAILKKASTASIRSAMSINGGLPFLNARGSSLKRSTLAKAQAKQAAALVSRFD